MATALLTRRFISEYTRRPLNVVLLVVVPLVFVFLSAGAISDFASVVGFVDDPDSLAGPTAGWAAAFLAGVAGFFQFIQCGEKGCFDFVIQTRLIETILYVAYPGFSVELKQV